MLNHFVDDSLIRHQMIDIAADTKNHPRRQLLIIYIVYLGISSSQYLLTGICLVVHKAYPFAVFNAFNIYFWK